MSELRIGVIGLSRGMSFAAMCRAVGGACVTALYDTDAERARSVAADLGATAFAALDPFLDSGIQAVVVASPVPFHAEQSVAALRRRLHVLSEVTACRTLEEARALADAARHSPAVYMFAENYRYLDEVELIKRMADDGRFGDLYYGEGEYLHDCQPLWRRDGQLTWRGRGEAGVYCTHSLGPLLYIFDDRVETVSCLDNPPGPFDPEVRLPIQHVMLMRTVRGRMLRVRVDHVSRRPHQMAYYSVQGAAGSYEAWRGLGDRSKVWLEDAHEPSATGAQWHDLHADFAARYIPDRLNAPEEARRGGHGASEYWLLRDFLAACRGEIPCPIDAFRGLDYTVPGICALDSAARGGAPVPVPDFRSAR